MRLHPVTYVPAGQPRPSAAQIQATRLLVEDAAMVLLRKTGRRVDVAPPIVQDGGPLDLTVDLRDEPFAWSTVRDALRAAGADPAGDVYAAVVMGRPGDASGLGDTAESSVARGAEAPPDVGGLALVGEWNVRWAAYYHENSRGADEGGSDDASRLGYGLCIAKMLHEIGHALGLPHPADLQTTATVMGYNPGPIVMGYRGANLDVFTAAELATLRSHELLARADWTPDPAGMTGVYAADRERILRGVAGFRPEWVLGFGVFEGDYA